MPHEEALPCGSRLAGDGGLEKCAVAEGLIAGKPAPAREASGWKIKLSYKIILQPLQALASALDS